MWGIPKVSLTCAPACIILAFHSTNPSLSILDFDPRKWRVCPRYTPSRTTYHQNPHTSRRAFVFRSWLSCHALSLVTECMARTTRTRVKKYAETSRRQVRDPDRFYLAQSVRLIESTWATSRIPSTSLLTELQCYAPMTKPHHAVGV